MILTQLTVSKWFSLLAVKNDHMSDIAEQYGDS